MDIPEDPQECKRRMMQILQDYGREFLIFDPEDQPNEVYRIFEDVSCIEEQILHWASEHGEALPMLDFSCPTCDSKTFSEISTGVEISREIVAVCEVSENDESEKKPMVALVPDRNF